MLLGERAAEPGRPLASDARAYGPQSIAFASAAAIAAATGSHMMRRRRMFTPPSAVGPHPKARSALICQVRIGPLTHRAGRAKMGRACRKGAERRSRWASG